MAFQKGQSGNPGGKPKYSLITHKLREKLASRVLEDRKDIPILSELGEGFAERYAGLTWAEAIVRKALVQAALGDKDARAWISDRAEGKPQQSLELSGDIERPAVIVAEPMSPEEWQRKHGAKP